MSVVRATAVRSLRALLGMVTSFPPSDSNIFLLYIFPALQVIIIISAENCLSLSWIWPKTDQILELFFDRWSRIRIRIRRENRAHQPRVSPRPQYPAWSMFLCAMFAAGVPSIMHAVRYARTCLDIFRCKRVGHHALRRPSLRYVWSSILGNVLFWSVPFVHTLRIVWWSTVVRLHSPRM